MAKKIDKLKDMFFASCPTGLEELLAAEIKQLQYQKIEITKGGVHFESPAQSALELVLSSRIASRIYKKAYQFEIKIEKDLYFFAKEIKWKALFNLSQTFKISVVQSKSKDGKKRSKFKSTMFLAQNLKDGIVDRFRFDTKGERPSVDKEQADMSLLLHIEPNINPHSVKETVTILIDMTGAPLSQRGYRDTNFSAPLKENLAAGLVLLSGYTGKETLVDPMCGSATIIIESLLIKADIPPCYLALDAIIEHNETSYWDFMQHNWFIKDKYLTESWEKLKKLYLKKAQDGFKFLENNPIMTFASDSEKYAINASKFNLKAADLIEFVKIEQKDATNLIPASDTGIVITNPPYGERIGEEEKLPELYHDFGENLKKNFKGFYAYIFTGNLPLIKKISLRTSKKIILYNGNIESRLVEYKLF
ncbi:MAG: THUMP domain-containing protein [Bacteriovoracaceae bacterium]|jgi:23S rRNA G2445 N2-methylase RlmL|nr:THUMP domain-containing protein [Bacteriovoracaceae bacterium]